ncbi:NAD-dependent epimerase/dehydratase family protein [Knoellia koreensis]|uniref:NAD-dependent epimerase/dehydratase family protein n=1 Tax=Knoellia koreensis TaxID=2730921 RepID=A0A849HDE8_9MICO|nr:NAD-dependent epimerase/dehydratase family protein [Knoellia sp. DB2414S]
MIVAVTGATGNIGSVVTRQLLDRGHEVRGVARRVPGASTDDTLRWYAVDLSKRGAQGALRPVLAGADAVVHTAWGFQPTRDTAYLEALDIGGTDAVLRAARAEGVHHLVHVSSVGVYSPGRGAGPVDETWPRGGTADLTYSRDKAAAEQLLDAHEAEGDSGPVVTRVRPSLFARGDIGGALDRYTLPSLLPAQLVAHLPLLPLDRDFRVQVTHTEDIAAGIVSAVEGVVPGPFNLAAEPVLTRADVARALDATPVHLPWQALRLLAALAWRLRLQPVDPGWLDMAWDVPVLSSERARRELEWSPRHDPRDVLTQAVAGMAAQTGTETAALRPRRWTEQLVNLLRHGPVSRRPMA